MCLLEEKSVILITLGLYYGRYIATYLGNDIRSNRPRIPYIWEKAKGSSPINYRHRFIYHPLFYIERIHACNCGRWFGGATIFFEAMTLVKTYRKGQNV